MSNWIVVVDDEALSLTNARNLLGSEKMKVSCLISGKQLLKFMEKNDPDLILLDVMMPEMDGFETYTALRNQEKEKGKREIPVIFLTGEMNADAEQKGLKLGASDFIHKPFNKDVLLRRIKNTIEYSKKIESLTEDATIDKLTGFLNKASGVAKVKELCGRQTGALMVLDLDSFKLVNDLFGHDMGDRVLASFADVIRMNARSRDTVCRIGGDEFMAFFGNLTEEEEAMALTKRFNEQFVSEVARLLGPDHGIPIGISIGVVMIPEYGREYERLFPMADEALYIVKQNGKHGCCVYKSAEKADDGSMDPKEIIARLTKIMEERGDGGGAMILGTESFAEIYHFVMRFIKRYEEKAVRLLFVVKGKTKLTDDELKEVSQEFGEVLKNTLRRSDFILQNKVNQFFILLPMTDESDVTNVVRRVMSRWELEKTHERVDITYATEKCIY